MLLIETKQRLYAALLILGACILLFRTIAMVIQGSLAVLVAWVGALIFAEMLIDLGCVITAVPWLISGDGARDRLPLRFGAAAAILHAARVLIFAMGRAGPWVNFDVQPAARALHYTRWTWGEVYFASIMSVLGVIGVIVIWLLRLRAKRT